MSKTMKTMDGLGKYNAGFHLYTSTSEFYDAVSTPLAALRYLEEIERINGAEGYARPVDAEKKTDPNKYLVRVFHSDQTVSLKPLTLAQYLGESL